MSKKITLFILVIIIVLAATYFYSANRSLSTGNMTNNEDTKLIKNITEIEKNLVLAQTHEITFDEFKDKTTPYIYSHYKEGYFDELYKQYNESPGYLAASTKTPIYQYVSKVYTNNDKTYKSIFIKIPLEGTTSQNAKIYTFLKENSEWSIMAVNNYILVLDRNEPKNIIDKFTNYNNNPIEYVYTKILE